MLSGLLSTAKATPEYTTLPDGPYVGEFSSLALDSAGNPVVSYFDNTNDDLKVLHCGNPSCTAGNTTEAPDTQGFVGWYTSLMLDAAGNPVVSYYDYTNGALKVLHCGDPSCSVGNTINSPDTVGDVGLGTALALNAAGNPVVAYFDAYQTELKVMTCGDANCAADNVVAAFDVSVSSVAIALSSFGHPVVSYAVSGLGTDLELLFCGNNTCTANNSVSRPDGPGNVGWYSSLALDGADRPVVSYYDDTNGDLKVLYCGNSTCSAVNTVTTPDSGGNVGWYTSLALDSMGFPVVSYASATDNDLKVLHCGNRSCSAGNTVTVPDIEGSVGGFTSLELDVAGNPVVSYHGFGKLKLLHCSNATCYSDADDDGCSDAREAVSGPGSELYGGRRNPKNPNDYFNPSHDGVNRVDDILLVVNQYFDDDGDGNPGLPPYDPGYNPDTDRTLVGPNAWNLGPPNGLQRVDDILNQVKQYFHDCS